MRKQYQGLTRDSDADTSRGSACDIIELRIDLALLMGPVLEPGLRCVDLGQMESAWVAAPKFGLGDSRTGLADLVNLPILTFSRQSDPHIWQLPQFEELRLPPSVRTVVARVTFESIPEGRRDRMTNWRIHLRGR